jgi:molybdopterin-guanine dinucleotide biosynthesis protein A
MGRDKASLPFGDERMLDRVVRVVSDVVGEVLLVARAGQAIAARAKVVRDSLGSDGMGPLAGLVAGLEAMEAERAFLTSCDVPLLRPAYVERLLELSQGHALAVPVLGGRHMMTSAVYSRAVLPAARELLAARRLRPYYLLETFDARIVTPDEIGSADPELASLHDCNTPEAYEEALRLAGFA